LVLVFVAIAIGVLVLKPRGHSSQHSRRGSAGTAPGKGRPGSGSQLQPLGIPGRWHLLLDSEFSGRRLDGGVWRPGWFGDGISGPINQHESACYSAANVSLSGQGALKLTVSRQQSTCRGMRRPFTGAALSSNPDDGRSHGGFTYRYGVLEARVYLPGAGWQIADWPAVETFGQVWPRDGEDDVMENLGGLVCFHFHSPGHAPGGNLGGCDPGLAPGWHVVSSDWEPGSVTWYCDGIEVARTTRGVTSAPMYIVLVNSTSSKSPEVARPDVMLVDYVRVWRRSR
jgi:beta-glucanase (GH16 family)